MLERFVIGALMLGLLFAGASLLAQDAPDEATGDDATQAGPAAPRAPDGARPGADEDEEEDDDDDDADDRDGDDRGKKPRRGLLGLPVGV